MLILLMYEGFYNGTQRNICMNFDQKNIFPAHINDFGTIQSVREHCLGTAEISEKILFTPDTRR